MEHNPLSLIVKEKTLGSLVTNAKDVRARVVEKLKEYSVDNYNGDVAQAKADRAELNKAADVLNDSRIALEKEWNKPFQEFKDVVSETVGLIKNVSSQIDLIVKADEKRQNEEKKAEIQAIWNSKNFNLVSLDKVFNSKWLNKSAKMPKIETEIDGIITKTTKDLEALESFGQDTAILKDLYLSTLNLQATLTKGAELKANRERLEQLEAEKKAAEQKAAEERAMAEQQSKESENQTVVEVDFEKHEVKEAAKVELPKAPVESSSSGKTYIFNVYGNANEIESVRAIAEEMNLEVIPSITLRGNAEEIARFKELLADNGIGYDKQGIINLAAKRI